MSPRRSRNTMSLLIWFACYVAVRSFGSFFFSTLLLHADGIRVVCMWLTPASISRRVTVEWILLTNLLQVTSIYQVGLRMNGGIVSAIENNSCSAECSVFELPLWPSSADIRTTAVYRINLFRGVLTGLSVPMSRAGSDSSGNERRSGSAFCTAIECVNGFRTFSVCPSALLFPISS